MIVSAFLMLAVAAGAQTGSDPSNRADASTHTVQATPGSRPGLGRLPFVSPLGEAFGRGTTGWTHWRLGFVKRTETGTA